MVVYVCNPNTRDIDRKIDLFQIILDYIVTSSIPWARVRSCLQWGMSLAMRISSTHPGAEAEVKVSADSRACTPRPSLQSVSDPDTRQLEPLSSAFYCLE